METIKVVCHFAPQAVVTPQHKVNHREAMIAEQNFWRAVEARREDILKYMLQRWNLQAVDTNELEELEAIAESYMASVAAAEDEDASCADNSQNDIENQENCKNSNTHETSEEDIDINIDELIDTLMGVLMETFENHCQGSIPEEDNEQSQPITTRYKNIDF